MDCSHSACATLPCPGAAPRIDAPTTLAFGSVDMESAPCQNRQFHPYYTISRTRCGKAAPALQGGRMRPASDIPAKRDLVYVQLQSSPISTQGSFSIRCVSTLVMASRTFVGEPFPSSMRKEEGELNRRTLKNELVPASTVGCKQRAPHSCGLRFTVSFTDSIRSPLRSQRCHKNLSSQIVSC